MKSGLEFSFKKIVEEALNELNKRQLTEGLTLSYAPRQIQIFLHEYYHVTQYDCQVTIMPRNPKEKHEEYQIKFFSNAKTTRENASWTDIELRFAHGIKQDAKYHKWFIDMMQAINRFGWFVANVLIYSTDKVYGIYKSFGEDFCQEFENKPFTLVLEAKFDEAIMDDSQLPTYAYHICPLKVVNKILREGLIPKDNYRSANHPSRVYMFLDFAENWRETVKLFKGETNSEPWALLRVHLPKTPTTHDWTVIRPLYYFDSNPNSKHGTAIWTYEPIPPKCIELIGTEEDKQEK